MCKRTTVHQGCGVLDPRSEQDTTSSDPFQSGLLHAETVSCPPGQLDLTCADQLHYCRLDCLDRDP